MALALSLPSSQDRDLILTMTYIMVTFSILVQGLTVKYVATREVLRTINLDMLRERFFRRREKDQP